MNRAAKIQSQDANSDLLTVERAAKYLQLSTSSYIREGKLQAYERPARQSGKAFLN